MKKIVYAFLTLLLSAMPAAAQSKTASPDPFHDQVTYYYLDKNPAFIPGFLKWLQTSDELKKNPDELQGYEGFLSVVFADNPSMVDSWTHATNFTGKTLEVVDYASKSPAAPDAMAIKSSSDLDKLWGAYFASGNTAYLKKITEALGMTTEASIRSAAAFSLGSNMTQHESVDRFLSHESEARLDATGTALKNIVSNVRKQREARAMPHRDGEFSALLFVMDPKVAEKEFAKTSDGVVSLKDMKQAKVGSRRTTVLVFAGMQLDPGYKADVTYDVQLIDPEGKTYSDLKDLEGVKRKLPTRFRIFHNQAAVFINFEQKDPLGVYKVNVLLKDNVGKKSIPLASEITLKKK